MIFIDTSVWVEFFRGRDGRLVSKLNQFLDEEEVALAAPVRIELLSGASRSDHPRLRKLFSALPQFYPRKATWSLIEKWLEKAAAKGQRFAMADLLIAAIVSENEAALWSLDRDFARMSSLKFLRCVE